MENILIDNIGLCTAKPKQEIPNNIRPTEIKDSIIRSGKKRPWGSKQWTSMPEFCLHSLFQFNPFTNDRTFGSIFPIKSFYGNSFIAPVQMSRYAC